MARSRAAARCPRWDEPCFGDEEHTAGGAIRLLVHDLSDKALESSDAVLAFAAAEQLGAMHVPGGEVGQRAGTRIFMLDIDRAMGGGRQ